MQTFFMKLYVSLYIPIKPYIITVLVIMKWHISLYKSI